MRGIVRAASVAAWLSVPVLTSAAGPAALLEAVQRGDAAAVRTAIAAGANVRAADTYGNTALHGAVERDDIDVIDRLLKAGADPAAMNRYGVGPLSLAATNGSSQAIERLVKAGAPVNTTMPGGETALMTAARTGAPEAVKLLLALGADANARETLYGQTALMWAAMQDNAEAIRILIEGGADVHATSSPSAQLRDGGMAAAPLIQTSGNAGAINPVRGVLFTPQQTSERLAQEFLTGRDSVIGSNSLPRPSGNFTPLLFAARNGRIPAVKALLAGGARIQDTTTDGLSALMLAVTNAHWELASVLLDHGADAKDARAGWTALHQIAHTRTLPVGHLPPPVPTGALSSLDLARKLIARGADVNARQTDQIRDGHRWRFDGVGATPFFRAAKGVDRDLMRLLLDAGADPHLTNVNHTTPLMVAAGVSMFNPGEDSGTSEDALEAVTLLLERGADVAAVNDNGEDAMHGSAYRGATAIVQVLADRGARLDRKNVRGWTPLMIADGVFYSYTYKTQQDAAALLRRLLTAKNLPTADLRTDEDMRGAKLQ